jgi:hypothetical protein
MNLCRSSESAACAQIKIPMGAAHKSLDGTTSDCGMGNVVQTPPQELGGCTLPTHNV